MLKAACDVAIASGNTTTGTSIAPLIVLCPDAQEEAKSQNRFTQAIVGANEGATKGITELFSSDITDKVLQSADGTNYRGIDDYFLDKLLAAAFSSSNRPATTDVLDQLMKVIVFAFNFCKKM